MESDNSEEEFKTRPEKKSRGSYKFKDTFLTRDEYNIATGKSMSYKKNN